MIDEYEQNKKIDENELIVILKSKINYFYTNKIPIHISLKTSKFLNGIIKKIDNDFFIIDDFVEGEQPIFFIEILPNGVNSYKKEVKE